MNLIDHITLDDLKGEQRELAELIGLEMYLKLVKLCGGCDLYIAKPDKLESIIRDKNINKEFTGDNYSNLALKYGLSERAIRDIVKQKNNDECKQINLFD